MTTPPVIGANLDTSDDDPDETSPSSPPTNPLTCTFAPIIAAAIPLSNVSGVRTTPGGDVPPVRRTRHRLRRPSCETPTRRSQQGLDSMRGDSCRSIARRPCLEPAACRRLGRHRVVRAFPRGAPGRRRLPRRCSGHRLLPPGNPAVEPVAHCQATARLPTGHRPCLLYTSPSPRD